MALRGGKPDTAQPPSVRCDACQHIPTNTERTQMVEREGQKLMLCVDPLACRLRAERAGIYKVVA